MHRKYSYGNLPSKFTTVYHGFKLKLSSENGMGILTVIRLIHENIMSQNLWQSTNSFRTINQILNLFGHALIIALFERVPWLPNLPTAVPSWSPSFFGHLRLFNPYPYMYVLNIFVLSCHLLHANST